MKSLVILLPLLLGSTLALQPDGGHGFMTEEHRAAIVQWLQAQHK